MNQLIMVGKVVDVEKEKRLVTLIPVLLNRGLNEALKYISLGVVIGIKARVEINNDLIGVVAEKVTFINRGSSDE